MQRRRCRSCLDCVTVFVFVEWRRHPEDRTYHSSHLISSHLTLFHISRAAASEATPQLAVAASDQNEV